MKQFDDQQKVDLDAEQLEIYNADNVKGNLRLVTKGEQGSTITWTSSRPTVVKGTAEAASNATQLGWVSRQATEVPVKLTATITNGSASKERTFDLTVKKQLRRYSLMRISLRTLQVNMRAVKKSPSLRQKIPCTGSAQ